MQIIFLVAALSCAAAVSIYPSQLPPRPQDKSQFCADPRFACQDLHSAHHCDSVKICIQEVWEKIKLPKANNEVCDICKDMVKQARDQLLSNETQEELKEVFEGSCNLIPVKVFAAECRKLVDDYIPDLVDMLASRMDPQTVCTVAGLCPFGSLRHIIREQQEQGQISYLIKTKAGLQEKDCHFCKDIMSFIKEVVGSVTEKEFVNAVMKFCIEDLAEPQSECAIITEVARVLRIFIEDLSDERCYACEAVSGLVNDLLSSKKVQDKLENITLSACSLVEKWIPKCSDDVKEYFPQVMNVLQTLTDPTWLCAFLKFCPSTNPPSVDFGGNKCGMCEILVNNGLDVMLMPEVQEKVHNVLGKMCSFTWIFKDKCEVAVDKYFDTFYNSLMNTVLDSSSLCYYLKYCSSLKKYGAEDWTPDILPVENGDTFCVPCRILLGIAQTQLQMPNIENALKGKLLEVCNKTKGFSELCAILVSDTFVDLYQYLVNLIVTPDLCDKIGLCSADTSDKEIPVTVNKGVCTLCKDLAKVVLDYLSRDSTRDEIFGEVSKLCSLLGPLSTQCQKLLDENFNSLYDFIFGELDADIICDTIRLCQPSLKTKVMLSPSATNKNNKKCKLCELWREKAQNYLGGKSFKNDIQSLKTVCAEFGNFSSKCQQYVEKYQTLLTKLSTTKHKSELFCSSISMCQNKAVSKGSLSVEVCEICQRVAADFQELLTIYPFSGEIEKMLGNVCDKLGRFSETCKSIVNFGVSNCYGFILTSLDPDLMCSFIKLCPEASISFEEWLRYIECNGCMAIVGGVKNKLLDFFEDKSKARDTICSYFPMSFRAYCETALTEYIPTIYKFVYIMEAMEACGMVNMCPKSNKTPKSKKIQLDDTLTCEFCENLVQYVRNIISSNTTKEEFRTAFQNFCEELGVIKDECEKMVDEYFDMIYDFILNDLDPKSFCSAIGLCESISVGMVKMLPAVKITSFQPLVKLFPAEKVHRQDKYGLYKKNLDDSNSIEDRSSLQLPENRLVLPHFILNHDIDCAVCQAVMYFVETEIHKLDVRSKPALKKMLEEVCSTWAEDVGTQCSHFVDKYLDIILDLLMKEVKPSEICNLIKVCTDNIKIPEVTVKVVSPPLDTSDSQCTLCNQAVKYLKNEMEHNKPEEAIKAVLENFCHTLPQSNFKECEAFVNKYTEMMVDLLIQEINPEKVCEALKQCPERERNDILISEVSDSFECLLCKQVMTYLEKELEDKPTEEAIKNALEKVCSILPQSLSKECDDFVKEYADLIIKLLLQELDPNIVCDALKLCPGQQRNDVQIATVTESIQCTLCKQVMAYLDKELEDKPTEEAIKNALEKVCSILPQSLSKECDDFVKEYADLIITLLVQELDPNTVCDALKLCPGNKISSHLVSGFDKNECEVCKVITGYLEEQLSEESTEEEIRKVLDQLCSELPESESTICKKFIDTYSELILTMIARELKPGTLCGMLKMCPDTTGEVECTMCQYILHFIQTELYDTKNQEAVKSVIDRACEFLPGALSETCKSFVDMYGSSVMVILAQDIDPSVVCPALNICPANVSFSSGLKVESKQLNSNEVECEACKLFAEWLHTELEDQRSQDDIKKALEKMCTVLPSSVLERCQKFVNKNIQSVITILSLGLDPHVMCPLFDYCPGEDEVKKKIECQTCHWTVQYIHQLLQNVNSEAEIKEMVEEVCKMLPGAMSNSCHHLVVEHGNDILGLLTVAADTDLVCSILNTCPAAAPEPILVKNLNLDTCEVCQLVVDYADKMLENDDFEKDIVALVEKICGVVPTTVSAECQSIIQTYGPYMLQMIGQLANSKEVCQAIDLCKATTGQVHVLGGKKCSFGPSYWCASDTHASACNAVSYCKQKVWKK
ncbi:prosaposin isoform X4 [Tachypleus tridentatus]|uniref:prosaposin isoform X4 n=1 Tax=Tachypleus tridentatus TaxID=6853 RepID=UPI003FD4BC7E